MKGNHSPLRRTAASTCRDEWIDSRMSSGQRIAIIIGGSDRIYAGCKKTDRLVVLYRDCSASSPLVEDVGSFLRVAATGAGKSWVFADATFMLQPHLVRIQITEIAAGSG